MSERSTTISSRRDLRKVTSFPCNWLADGQWLPSADCSDGQAHPGKAGQASEITHPSGDAVKGGHSNTTQP